MKSKSLPVRTHSASINHPVDLDRVEQALHYQISRASRLQESSDGTDDGHEGSASLGSSAGELRRSRLGGSWGSSWGSSSGRRSRSSAVGGVGDNDWGSAGLVGDSGGRLDGRWGGGDSGVGGGVDAVLVNNGGALGDSVGLGANAEGGGAADGGETGDNGGLVDGSGAHDRDGVTSWGGDSWVGGGSHGGGVDGRVAVGGSVGGGSEADDSEGAHVDCWGYY